MQSYDLLFAIYTGLIPWLLFPIIIVMDVIIYIASEL